jgi:hypothetical protein
MGDCGCNENAPACLLGEMQYRIVNFYARRIRRADFAQLPDAARESWIVSHQEATEKYMRHIQENERCQHAS